MSAPKSAMLFAAGFGTRMGALTADQPKPMIKVAGQALVDHTLDLLEAIGPLRIVANTHYKPDALVKHLTPKGVAFSHEQPNILETGAGLRAALPLLGAGPVFTMNTDTIWRGPNPLELLLTHWDGDKMDALLVCLPKENTIGHTGKGDFCIDGEGHVTRGTDFIYGGIQITKTDGLSAITETAFSLNILWDKMLAAKRLFAVSYSGKWCDVGHPAGIEMAETLIREHHV